MVEAAVYSYFLGVLNNFAKFTRKHQKEDWALNFTRKTPS